MRLLSVALAALVLSSSADAGEIIWRSPTTGTLKLVAPPPELEIPPPPSPEAPIDLGVSYGSHSVRAGASLAISPVWSAGHPQLGYTFRAEGRLPMGLLLDPASGAIRGIVYASVAFAVMVADAEGRSQSVPVVIVVE